jgi:response regulator RpfG family c-di-GMP phosphodiesterase
LPSLARLERERLRQGVRVRNMHTLHVRVERLPIVLVVDPLPDARFTMWRLLGRRFGVLEAADARAAREWIACRPDIDALVVQRTLPDTDGNELVKSLATAWSPAKERAIVTDRDGDMRSVVATLAGWFFCTRAGTLTGRRPEVDHLAS